MLFEQTYDLAFLLLLTGKFREGAQLPEVPDFSKTPEDPVVDCYISSGCLCALGLAIYKYILGHHGPGTVSVRFGMHNRSSQYHVFQQQAARLRATSGTQWIFDRENADFRFGQDLVHPDLYTELSAVARAYQMAGQGSSTAPAIGDAELMQQMI